MNYYNFKLEVDDKELNDKLFQSTNKILKEKTKELQEQLFNGVVEDIENFMYERFENVQEQYFREITNFLLDKDYTTVRDKEKLSDWLKGLGYDQQSFRKKIYQDNKDEIVQQISYDSAYELVKNMFDSSYFRSWDFSDIGKGYPQSQVVRGFLNALVEEDGFQKYLHELMDKGISSKLEEINNLNEYIVQLESKVDRLEDN